VAYYFNDQVIDNRPGHYYVSMMDGPKNCLLLGPFASHMSALLRVEQARKRAIGLDPWAHFYAFGTCRVDVENPPEARLNGLLGGRG
jgi:hypothetical protein